MGQQDSITLSWGGQRGTVILLFRRVASHRKRYIYTDIHTKAVLDTTNKNGIKERGQNREKQE